MSSWGTIKGGCPCCGSDLKWWNYGADCRGNPGDAGVRCLNACHLNEEQVKAFWSDLRVKKQHDWDELCRKDKKR